MSKDCLSVRELMQEDIELIIDYWLTAADDYLEEMGADKHKMPGKKQWEQMLTEQLNSTIENKKSYCIIWCINDEAVGHCNINKIVFAKEAFMHLHIWKNDVRRKGYGTHFIKLTLPYFFNQMKLTNIYCEPYALNPAPNNTLRKAGFEFIKEYSTVPGSLNFEQPVKLWQLSYERFQKQILP